MPNYEDVDIKQSPEKSLGRSVALGDSRVLKHRTEEAMVKAGGKLLG